MEKTEVQKTIAKNLNQIIKDYVEEGLVIAGDISDGYHTFDELYDIRKVYNAALFNEWGNPNTTRRFIDEKGFDGIRSKTGIKYNVHKSIRHNDGELCFGGGWFIVVALLPDGQISNHYKMEDWDLFKIPEYPKALYPFDGHETKDVIERLKNICK